MSEADRVKAQYVQAMARVGEDVFIRRFTGAGTPRPHSDMPVRARVTGYQPGELIGSIVQGDRKVIALADPIVSLLPITTVDKIVIRGKECAIKSVDDNTRRIAGTLIALEIQVSG